MAVACGAADKRTLAVRIYGFLLRIRRDETGALGGGVDGGGGAVERLRFGAGELGGSAKFRRFVL